MAHDPLNALAPTMPLFSNVEQEPASPLAPGQYVGNFRIVRLVGKGGMGCVYEAMHDPIERRVAIKALYPQYAAIPQLVARFLNEARAVNRARHPALVEIFDFGTVPDGTPYLVMEYLEGEPLSDRLADGKPLPLAEALRLARQLAFALAAAHKKGIVHRDLKPENVIVLRDPDPPFEERIKVLDFGLAKFSDIPAASHQQTGAGVTLGTPSYMSPEQCMGLVSVDGKADVYALGIMLFEMLTGRLPFEAETTFDYMALHVRREPPSVRSFNPQLSGEVAALVQGMLAKKPAQRPDTASVAQELARLEGLRTPAPRVVTPVPAREGPVRVLIIDDDIDLATTLQTVLEAHGYPCQTLYSADGALDVMRGFGPQVVLLDIELPGKSGYKLCWELKSNPATRETIVVLMSAKARESDQKLGIAMQADAFLAKPFDVTLLLSVVQLLLEQRDESAAAF